MKAALPRDWAETTIGDVFDRVSKPIHVDEASIYQEIGIRSHGKGIFEKKPVPGAVLGEKRVFAVEPDCLILNIVFAWEQAVARTTLTDVGKVVSHRFPMYRPKPGRIDVDYALTFFKSKWGKNLLEIASPGGAGRNKTLNQNDFGELPIVVPPLNQQRRIVAVLDAWDQAISQAERLIAANRFAYRSKLNTFASLEGASTRRLDQIARINVRSLRATTDPEFEFEYFDIAAAEDGSEGELSGRILFKNAPSRARRLVADEAVVYSTVRPLLRRLFTAKRRPDIVYSTGYSILEPTESCMVGYLKHLLVSDFVERQIYARLTGSGYPAINENDLAEIRIPLPGIDKQIAICAMLDAHEKQQSIYLKYSRALRAQRRGLMQKLLTGEWRLDERFDVEALSPHSLNVGARS